LTQARQNPALKNRTNHFTFPQNFSIFAVDNISNAKYLSLFDHDKKEKTMKKYCYLFFISLFMTTKAFSLPVVDIDSLLTAVQKVPESKKPEMLKKTVFQVYRENPAAAVGLAHQLENLPDKVMSVQEKVAFFDTLSKKFEQVKNFKDALISYKTADSLRSASFYPPREKPSRNAVLPAAFYLFAFVLLAGTAWIIFLFIFTKKTLTALRKAEKEMARLKEEAARAEKQIQDELSEKAGQLQKEMITLREQELALKTALKKVEEANYLRNAFIANLGFDVRTPLSGIIGFANMLETELAVKEDSELYEYAANIEKSSSRLLKLLDNVIDFASLEANTLVLKIKPMAPEKIIKNVFEQYRSKAADKNLIFKSKIGKELNTVLADENGLEKVLVQIVDNAIKYTEKGFVTITASYSEETDTDVIEIKDNGPGIPVEKQKYLFDVNFSQDTGEGTGIGLKLAKKYIEMMKGRLFLESVPGKGTTVTFHLPCSEEAVVEEHPAEAVAGTEMEVSTADELGNLDIFVVEDDRMNRIILEQMLKQLGTVKLTVDGDDCLHTVAKEAEKGHFYQVMLFDINLPGDWDGIKLLKVIREKYPEYRKIPFIAQTAYAMSGDKDRLLKEGFDSYLAKPIDKNELITTIKQQLRIFGQNQEK